MKSYQRDYEKYETNYQNWSFEPVMVEYRRKVVIDSLSKYSHNNILEIGCGKEPLFKYFTDYSKMSIIEPCNSFYQHACSLKNSSNIDIYNDLFENLSDELKDKKFDFIIVSSLLHEVPDYIEFLKKIHSISTTTTTIHINVPNAYSFHRILASEMGLIDSVFKLSPLNIKMQQNNVFSLKSLTEELIKQKFNILETSSYFFKPFTNGQMDRMIENGIIDKSVLDGLSKINRYFPDFGAEVFINCSIS